MQCPACDGAGCAGCKGTGQMEITRCPLEIIDAETAELIELAALFKKGLPPIAGGSLDQAQSFLAAARFVFREEARLKAELGVIE